MRQRNGRLVRLGLCGATLLGLLAGCGGGERATREEAPAAPRRPLAQLSIVSGGYSQADFDEALEKTDRAQTLRRDQKDYAGAETLSEEAVPVLQAFAKPEKRNKACEALARLEHGLGAIYLVRKKYATAWGHYKNSAFYYERGQWPIKLQQSGSLQRIEQMEQKLKDAGEALPDWQPPL